MIDEVITCTGNTRFDIFRLRKNWNYIFSGYPYDKNRMHGGIGLFFLFLVYSRFCHETVVCVNARKNLSLGAELWLRSVMGF